MRRTYESICAQQRAWADQKGIKVDKDGYTLRLRDNLFQSLSPETEEEFESGKGDELGSGDDRGKMQALHSSSALVLNVFEYWRNRNVDEIASVCGAPKGMTEMRFEQTHPTPLGGVPPHLDVEFRGIGVSPLAIESKFTEPYQRHTKRTIKNGYFSKPGLWVTLPKCENLAKRIHEEEQRGTSFIYLDAPQLLKHILGLTTTFGSTGFELLYLWYEVPSSEAARHCTEIKNFGKYIGDEVCFRDMTYQELFEAINKLPITDRDYISYLSYLRERYFPHQTS